MIVGSITEGTSTLESTGVLAATPNYNTYQLNVEGMKQVRWPGLNNATIGACFLDAEGVIISKYNMAVASALFDFVEGEYIFIDVPSGASTFVFTSASSNSNLEAIAVDSTEIEAIEPDWVESAESLCGIYEASVDSLTRLRSISGATVRVGTGTSTTSSEWQYDNDGNVIGSAPLGTINYTQKDFQNLASLRGEGYQLIDYEQSKILALLFFSTVGNRDAQLVCGYGKSSGGSTGYRDNIGNTNSVRGTGDGNKVLGLEGFMACTAEWMDNVAVNVRSYANFKKNFGSGVSGDPTDAVWHIYDPISGTERTAKGINASGYCIGRVKHGRFCDIIPSKLTSDNSRWNQNYCDIFYYTHSTGRVVYRSVSNASAYGGLVFSNALHVSSFSFTYIGTRLAFRGEIELD